MSCIPNFFISLFGCLPACLLISFRFLGRLLAGSLFYVCSTVCVLAFLVDFLLAWLGLFRSNDLWNLLVCDPEISVMF